MNDQKIKVLRDESSSGTFSESPCRLQPNGKSGVFAKQIPSEQRFKLAGSSVMQQFPQPNIEQDRKSIPFEPENRHKFTINFRNDCIKEEDEPHETPVTSPLQHTNRVRKTNDRIFSQMKLAEPNFDAVLPSIPFISDTKQPNIAAPSCKDIIQKAFRANPRISIEKSLGSLECPQFNVSSLPSKGAGYPATGAATTDTISTNKNNISARQRKLSMPVSTTSSLELPTTPKLRDRSLSPARRKFSNVSDAVTRRISTTMGWRSPATDEVVPQAKYLCSQYIRSRLKRAGLLNKKLGLQRLRSVANMAGGWEVCEVFPRVSCLGQEMERSHPKLYGSVVRQLSVSIKSDKVVRHLVLAISSHLLRTDVTWARLISLYAVAAALAADCVRQGHPEFVSSVIEGVGMAIEQHSCQWIVAQGGWSGVLVWSQPPAFEPTPLEMVGLVGGAGVLLAAIIGGALSLLGHLIS